MICRTEGNSNSRRLAAKAALSQKKAPSAPPQKQNRRLAASSDFYLRSMAYCPIFCPSMRQYKGFDMSAVQFLDETADPSGFVAADRLSAVLRITRAELAAAAGLPRDTVVKNARVRGPAAQARLRDIVEIINRASRWAGSPQQAFAWYRSQPIPSFGDQTAEALVKEDRAEAVKRYLDRIAVGGFA